jgi:ADP-ribose pyrophosphatase
MLTTHPCIGYSNERIEFFVAQDLQLKQHAREAGEFLDVSNVPLAVALEWIRDGTITDTKTITGLLWYARFRD